MKRSEKVILLLCLSGVVISLYLGYAHLKGIQDSDYRSACHISTYLDCDRVGRSKYGFVLGIPLFLLGLVFYLSLLLVATFPCSRGGHLFRERGWILFYLSLPAVIYSIYLLLISLFYIRALCLFCSFLYLINIGILILSFKGGGGGWKEWLRRPLHLLRGAYRDPLILTFLISFSLLLAISHAVYSGIEKGMARKIEDSRIQDLLKSKRYEIPLSPYDPVLGDPSAPLKVFVFADLQCGFCMKLMADLMDLYNRYRKRLCIVYKNFPLSSECNPAVKSRFHIHSCTLSKMGLCAERQGMFWELHEILFRSGRDVTPGRVLSLLRDMNTSMEEFKECVEEDEITEKVREDVETGREFGVRSTPTVFFNGMRLKGASASLYIERLIHYYTRREETGSDISSIH